jgi:DNA-directed RNA polymerase specialized sigma24 family protein
MNQTPHDDVPNDDPDQAFASVVALRLMADRLERKAVAAALEQGWSWARIAQALGVSKQAAHKRLSSVVPTQDIRKPKC